MLESSGLEWLREHVLEELRMIKGYAVGGDDGDDSELLSDPRFADAINLGVSVAGLGIDPKTVIEPDWASGADWMEKIPDEVKSWWNELPVAARMGFALSGWASGMLFAICQNNGKLASCD